MTRKAKFDTFVKLFGKSMNNVVMTFVVQLLSPAAHWASPSFTISQGLLKLMSIELVMLSNHHIYCFNYRCTPYKLCVAMRNSFSFCVWVLFP